MRITVKVVKNDKLWNKMVKNLSRGGDKGVDVGWWNSRHPSGEPSAQIAKWNEEGHMTSRRAYSPPRPFLRIGWMGKVRRRGLSKYTQMVDSIAMGKLTWSKLNSIIAKDLTESLRQEILDWKTPENSPYTVEKKGFNDPLIETGSLYDTIKSRTMRARK